MNARSFHLTVRGASHIKKDKVCQDASLSCSDEICSVAVVCDGHGGDDYIRSDVGSRAGCEAARKNILDFVRSVTAEELDRDWDMLLKRLEASIISDWNTAIHYHFDSHPLTDLELSLLSEKARKKYVEDHKIESAYGSTMIAVAMTREYWFGIHIGDGRCVAVTREGQFGMPIPWDKKCFLNVTTSICDSNALENFRHIYSRKLPAAIFVGSDGIDDCFKNKEQLYHLYKTVIYSFGTTDFDEAIEGLNEYLPRLSAKGSGDDASVAAVLDMEAIKELNIVKEYDRDKEKARVEEAARKEAERMEEERQRLEKEYQEKQELRRLEEEKREKQRLEREKREKERKEQLEKERLEKEQRERERLERQRHDRELLDQARREKERLDQEKRRREQQERWRRPEEPAPKFCSECGGKLEEGDKYCSSCGAPVRPSRDGFIEIMEVHEDFRDPDFEEVDINQFNRRIKGGAGETVISCQDRSGAGSGADERKTAADETAAAAEPAQERKAAQETGVTGADDAGAETKEPKTGGAAEAETVRPDAGKPEREPGSGTEETVRPDAGKPEREPGSGTEGTVRPDAGQTGAAEPKAGDGNTGAGPGELQTDGIV